MIKFHNPPQYLEARSGNLHKQNQMIVNKCIYVTRVKQAILNESMLIRIDASKMH